MIKQQKKNIPLTKASNKRDQISDLMNYNDCSRRVQTEAYGDTDDVVKYDIQNIMKKYQKKPVDISPTICISKKPLPTRASNNHSIDKNKKPLPSKNISSLLSKNQYQNKSQLTVYNDTRSKENQLIANMHEHQNQKISNEKFTINSQQRLKTEPFQQSSVVNNSQISAQKDPSRLTFLEDGKIVGKGTFGVVIKGRIKETGQIIAIKKVLQDKRYKNRELQILKELNHPNVLKIIHAYFSQGNTDEETYLHVVMPYIPETIYSLNKIYNKQRQYIPSILIKLYSYQLIRSLLYIHQIGICHRDIKPHNILVDPDSNRVVLCDFGSAKKLIKGEPNIAYICSRCYRAPELIFGATDYSCQIDMWSVGCVIAEMVNSEPLFIGESQVDQLVEIIKVLGTPSKDQILAMNRKYDMKEFKFPVIKSKDWKKVIRSKTDNLLVEFLSKILVYSPIERLSPIQALAHPYFDELRDEKKMKVLSAQMKIPNLFDFSNLELSMQSELSNKLIPGWYVGPRQN